MQISRNGLEFIKLHEGFRSEAYGDPVGILTIGYGFTNRSQAFNKWWQTFKSGKLSRNSTMTKAEASDALEYVIKYEYGVFVNMFLGHVDVPQHVFDAMVSVVYNAGPKALTWKWAKAAKDKDFRLAAELLAKTAVTATNPQTGRRRKLPGLVRRRVEEGILLHYGVYTGVKVKNPEIPLPKPVTPDGPIVVMPEPNLPKPQKSFWQALFDIFAKLFNRRK
jgi:GH24 family phage-related lysozyme (muramidase)